MATSVRFSKASIINMDGLRAFEKKKLIINTDDLNHDEAINTGIRVACMKGLVKSASVIVNRDILNSTVEIISEFPAVSFGLHFNLSRYRPVAAKADIPTLLNTKGLFENCGKYELLHNVVKELKILEVRRELEEQYNRFTEVFGQHPTHIDSHHYIHAYPPVIEAVKVFAADQEVPMRRPLSPYIECYSNVVGVCMPDFLTFGFRKSIPSQISWCEILDRLQPGFTEMVCHVRAQGTSRNKDDLIRERELAVICSDSSRESINRSDIQICSYYDLKYAK